MHVSLHDCQHCCFLISPPDGTFISDGNRPLEDVVLVVLPSRITISRGVEHSVMTQAHVRKGRLITLLTTLPRLSIRFSLLTYPSREAVNLHFFAQVFCWYTSFSVDWLCMMDAVSMELSSTIFIRTNYSTAIGLLNISDDDDKNDYDDDDEYNDDDNDEDNDDDDEDDYFDLVIDDDYHTYFDKRIGLLFHMSEDLGLTAPVLAMPCGHLFHPGCLMKWLERSCSCPLCRFSLPQEH
ncbi:hypothetical protein ZIOFF_070914 [Zingiber officinale]|uniref:RING-type domain-containing protein n=1 Tax=Zingiber officinale TaxID=94328 RepID=A0A8J5C0H3_ZINOF|nr:hypothetical protein ZIOFF_070914 [Zingiber officinale]